MKKAFSLITLIFFLQGCGLYYSRPVTKGVMEKKIEIGMSKKDVYGKIGAPSYVGKAGFSEKGKGVAGIGANNRSYATDMEGIKNIEVWVYNEYEPKPIYVFLGIITLGFGLLFPPDPEPQNLYFRGDILEYWDVFVPFVPEEIEKPEI